MRHGSLFSGIGGFDLAAEWMGWSNIFHCEYNEFGRKVLNYHFPQSKSYIDVTITDFNSHRGEIDILSGGFPCQPYSAAGKRLGKEDDRHLWPEMLRAIREIQPKWIVGENVLGLVNWNGGMVFDEVQADMENEGYKVQPYILPACSVNAPHRRDRVWFVAYSNSLRPQRRRNGRELPGKRQNRSQRLKNVGSISGTDWQNFPSQSAICGGDDGIPKELDSITFPKWRNESIKAYGNAIVPQVAYQIFKSIEKYESTKH